MTPPVQCESYSDDRLLSIDHLMPLPMKGTGDDGRCFTFSSDIGEVLEILTSTDEILSLEPIPIGPNGIQTVDPPHFEFDMSFATNLDLAQMFSRCEKQQVSSSKRPSDLPSPATKRRCFGIDRSMDIAKKAQYKAFKPANKIRSYQIDQWLVHFQELTEFKNTHSHLHVPHDCPDHRTLIQWIKRQRYQHKLKQMGRHSTLTDDRQQMLEDLGFVWDSHKTSWSERLDSLKQYKAEHGHCSPPSNHTDKVLAIWVKCQRRQYKLWCHGGKSTMNDERIELLNNLGFIWNPRSLA